MSELRKVIEWLREVFSRWERYIGDIDDNFSV